MRALITPVGTLFCGACVSVVALGCGSTTPAPIEVLLATDDSHACAGAVEITYKLAELNGDTREESFAAAVSPEQLDCDFDVGVAEALWSLTAGEIPIGVLYTVTIELRDSTGLIVGAGVSDAFQADPSEANDPVRIEVTRVALPGTALVDLIPEAGFAAAGDLSFVFLANTTPIDSRTISWPGDASLKRPLRISGLAGSGWHLLIDLEAADGTKLASLISETFSVGTSATNDFVTPQLNPR